MSCVDYKVITDFCCDGGAGKRVGFWRVLHARFGGDCVVPVSRHDAGSVFVTAFSMCPTKSWACLLGQLEKQFDCFVCAIEFRHGLLGLLEAVYEEDRLPYLAAYLY